MRLEVRLRSGRLATVSSFALLLAAGVPASAETQGVERLALIKTRVADNLGRQPDYTCLQTIERSQRAARSKRFKSMDTLRLEVALIGGKEVFSWPGESKFRNSDVSAIVGGGTLSSGGFLAAARAVFVSSGAVTKFAGEELVSGRTLVKYDYRVSSLSSGYQVAYSGQAAVVPFSGSFWADKETDQLVRLTSEVEDIPATVPIKGVTRSIDYGLVRPCFWVVQREPFSTIFGYQRTWNEDLPEQD